MATGYWRGATNSTWDLTSNWWTTLAGPTTVAAVPTTGQEAFFNANGTTTARNVYLNGSRAVGTLWLNGNAQGDITFLGGTSGVPTTQTLTLGGLDMSGAAANAVFSTVNIALSNNNFWSIASGRAVSVSGVVSGAFKLTSNNDGVIILLGANTYSGGTDITAGVVRAGTSTVGAITSGPLGTGTITMTGGKLSSNSTTARTLANALTLNGTVVLCDSTNNGLLTFSGALTIAGTTSLSIPANYVLAQGVFGGTGAFTITAGELDLEGATGTKSGGTTLSGGTLYLGFGVTSSDQLGNDTLTINSGSAIFCGSSTATLSNTITGSGGFLVARPRNATLTFSAAGAYAGVARILAGVSDGAGTTSQGMTFSSTSFPAVSSFSYVNQNTAAASVTQTFRYTGSAASVTTAATLSMTPTAASTCVWDWSPSTSGATCTVNGLVSSNTTAAHTLQLTNASTGLLSFTGGISQLGAGVLTLTKTGTGRVTLSGAGTFTGSVTVSAGTLNANNATALGAASNTAGIAVTSGATLSLGAALNYSSPGRTTTISGTGVSTGGALVHAFAGTANIGAINLGAAAYIRGTASGTSTLSSAISNGGFALTVGAATGNTLTLAGGVSGTGGLIIGSIVDGGTVTLSTANSYQGNTTLSYGTLSLGNATALGSIGALVFNGGTLDASTTLTVANAVTLSADLNFTGTSSLEFSGPVSLGASRNVYVGASRLTLSGAVSGVSFGLTKTGPGTLRLTNTNSYSGGTTLDQGTLEIGSNSALGSGALTFTNSSAVIDASSSVVVANALVLSADVIFGGTNALEFSANIVNPGARTFTTNGSGGSLTLSGVISGIGTSITKAGTNTLRLTRANTYSGDMSVSAGTLQAGNVQALGTSSTVTLTSGSATLQTLTAGGQNGKLTVAGLTNSAGGTIKIGG